ncbi:hypothetical protein MPTK1_4g21440 [Marchantia polymorpha subsp. ruderalis]|uniref:Protein arginine methyltransferase NDUFAF7 n=2 Tax=Marchantia polymorpha TaxID=3197 RepID=A0AAF6BCA9_MARPO|nr:hypothetical protein MARPO_0090s0077 [Marchantia polymorpha]BBN09643.1 hypothetical protein Mp_4g21440 [Marchantia polymorpha subsp. ruderalis]|eukprot:PTQ33343.1 hypothetical protein MARPO_0090s0077 [Marchantia polymorpha]
MLLRRFASGLVSSRKSNSAVISRSDLFQGLRCTRWTSHANSSTQVQPVPVVEADIVLVRDFIYSALYDENQGYFSARSSAVGELPTPINFNSLEGKRAYTQYIDNLYKRGDSSWFTPVELFQPYYGYALAEFILRTHSSSNPLIIYEIGGGTGTCARNILDYMKAHAPRTLYETMSYKSVEISGELAKKQYQKVTKGDENRKQFSVERRNASDRSGWGAAKKESCFVIMLEVLDNLPHDLVHRETSRSPWMEKWVLERTDGEVPGLPVEISKPLQDDLIIRCLEAMKGDPAQSRSVTRTLKNMVVKLLNASELLWIPTGCLKLLETLHSARPNMTLIASDFSLLPDVRLAGEGAPLVSSKKGGVNKDHATYLEAKGHTDIFFPTDFSVLQKLDHLCSAANGNTKTSRRSSVVNSAQFMDLFADTGKTLTRDGYNPLLEDFSNTKFYISTPAGGFKSDVGTQSTGSHSI